MEGRFWSVVDEPDWWRFYHFFYHHASTDCLPWDQHYLVIKKLHPYNKTWRDHYRYMCTTKVNVESAIETEITKFRRWEEGEVIMNRWHPQPFHELLGLTLRVLQYREWTARTEAELQEPAWCRWGMLWHQRYWGTSGLLGLRAAL